MIWNLQIINYITIHYNKPHIIIRNNEQGTYLFIDTVISRATNVIKKEPQMYYNIPKCATI
jgi:hypothetical protein